MNNYHICNFREFCFCVSGSMSATILTHDAVLIVLSGDLVLSDSPNASITILANDNAYGIFSFNQPLQRSTGEGTPVRLK